MRKLVVIAVVIAVVLLCGGIAGGQSRAALAPEDQDAVNGWAWLGVAAIVALLGRWVWRRLRRRG